MVSILLPHFSAGARSSQGCYSALKQQPIAKVSEMFKSLIFAIACTLLATSAFAASGTMIKEDALRASASAGGSVIAKVPKGAQVDVLRRQSGWTQISHEGNTGWVRILSVRTTTAGSNSVFGGILQMSTAQREPRRVVAVAGLRGLNEEASPTGRRLSEEQLRAARFNAQELALLERYISNRGDAENFAQGVGLNSLDLAYLPAMQKEPDTTGGGYVWGEGGL